MSTVDHNWLSAFPDLSKLDSTSAALLAQHARIVDAPAGSVLFADGGNCTYYNLVVEGVVRVQKVSESGREIVLYRVESGQSCVLNTSALMGDGSYTAEAVAETDIKVLTLPANTFQALLAASDVFRRFVFTAYSTRIADLLCLIEEVAFRRIDVRLAEFLLDRAGQDHELRITHHDLAVELGTAREVVSRQLKDFERRGWLSLFRGRIRLADLDGLRQLSNKQIV